MRDLTPDEEVIIGAQLAGEIPEIHSSQQAYRAYQQMKRALERRGYVVNGPGLPVAKGAESAHGLQGQAPDPHA